MTTATPATTQERDLPAHLLAGIALIAIAWPLAWAGPAPWSEHTFFPLWLGYILTVDGLTARRSGTSLLTRDPRRFVALFVVSVPLWWLFELANRSLGNWSYLSSSDFPPLAYVLLASLSFSTVMPAIFVTAAFWRTFPAFRREIRWIRIAPSPIGLVAIGAAGLAMFVASVAFPDVAFPLVWIGLFLFIDVINHFTGAKSIAEQVASCRWDTVLVLFAAGLTCGFFWEMWNVASMPKWEYDVPYAGYLKVFEMPILGYGGYLPFALEVYAAWHLLRTLLFRARDRYLTFDEARSGSARRTLRGA